MRNWFARQRRPISEAVKKNIASIAEKVRAVEEELAREAEKLREQKEPPPETSSSLPSPS